VGISVSRVGSKAQTAAMKKVAGRLKLDMGQYREVAAFAQFGTSELDKATRLQLERGQRIQEVLKQPQFAPVLLERQVMILYAVINGYLDDIPVERIPAFETEFYRFMEARYPGVGREIAASRDLTGETEEALKKAIAEFKQGFVK
ncbi:MAG: F0F1 ATP synthase subunit alpha, partial [Dehalococcoidales bacterium]|nr:F0F1 ATP synthase subunit alpha [Dehalococcoidales bacterium]